MLAALPASSVYPGVREGRDMMERAVTFLELANRLDNKNKQTLLPHIL